jgi:ParB family chromosome partitioning protein
MADKYYADSIFWVEVDRISPNPFQPRKEFDEARLKDLAESIRQYGVLQPLVVTRRETETPDGGIKVEYELIAGERRLRASKLARLAQVPVVIRTSDQSDQMKLEIAIIENLQREDINSLERAKAFQQLVDKFSLKHAQIAEKVGKSREFVSNTLRILALPLAIQEALAAGQITEGHTRPLLMLADRPEEQTVLFKEIVEKRISVRDSEKIARRIAVERARKNDLTPELLTLERRLTESLGTRVRIEQKEKGGKVTIDFFSPEDLTAIMAILAAQSEAAAAPAGEPIAFDVTADDKTAEEPEEDLYSVRNFSV